MIEITTGSTTISQKTPRIRAASPLAQWTVDPAVYVGNQTIAPNQPITVYPSTGLPYPGVTTGNVTLEPIEVAATYAPGSRFDIDRQKLDAEISLTRQILGEVLYEMREIRKELANAKRSTSG